ncbi:hypothetical protein ACIO02_35475 [Streptomyces sp. NPDC087568]|uniref:hypothetical protein n=1 Tax=Streptomyces sp. NPDC087568 TaxID=3365799 RepID=UPI0038042320
MPEPSYSDIQKAVRVEKFRVWFAWLAGNLLMLFIASATNGFAIVSVVTKVLFAIVFLLLTVTAYRMHAALNRRADRERRAVLGDDFPG